MRPIVSNSNARTYKLSKWLVKKFNEFEPPIVNFVKNSFKFVDKTRSNKIEEDEIIFCFDIVSLYPLPEAILVVKNWLSTTSLTEQEQDTLQLPFLDSADNIDIDIIGNLHLLMDSSLTNHLLHNLLVK